MQWECRTAAVHLSSVLLFHPMVQDERVQEHGFLLVPQILNLLCHHMWQRDTQLISERASLPLPHQDWQFRALWGEWTWHAQFCCYWKEKWKGSCQIPSCRDTGTGAQGFSFLLTLIHSWALDKALKSLPKEIISQGTLFLQFTSSLVFLFQSCFIWSLRAFSPQADA